MAKDRMDRKELKAPDEFITATTDAFTWAQKHLRTVLLGVGVAAALFLGAGFYYSHQAAQRRDANADLAAALATYRAGQFAEAAESFDRVADRWEGLSVAPLAAVLTANSRVRAGEAPAAIEILSEVPEDALPVDLRQQRAIAWATALEAEADWAAAATKYAEAAATGGPYTADAVVGEARVRARLGEKDRAAELYRKGLSDFPDRLNKAFIESQLG
jgi:tetratricopeptide (TPR) repeat protein